METMKLKLFEHTFSAIYLGQVHCSIIAKFPFLTKNSDSDKVTATKRTPGSDLLTICLRFEEYFFCSSFKMYKSAEIRETVIACLCEQSSVQFKNWCSNRNDTVPLKHIPQRLLVAVLPTMATRQGRLQQRFSN